ncbi:MAG: helix-turn-helix transcriptional regulator [Candidatus Fermentithermobacillus carboniphilus]|uniref:Helix-turn-helix transcriptional regulator n=1 Tax=Candidatus Fermentithermobacillus carboniphilus TaxID=3085328 RepID=A0AAT9LD58_9FIRM|nr:MAG: helix-turn-helix transcriptional regulator [Candidatus Fermentithermobacillus carboniphilus]
MSVGEKLRRIRQAQGLSVRSLARKVGVSPSLISQIERGQVSPSYSTLKSLGEALNEDPSCLTEREIPVEWVLIRKGGRHNIFTGQDGVSLELFAFPGPRDKRMEVFLLTLSPASIYRNDLLSDRREQDKGDDFLYVISGRVEVTTDRRSYALEQDEACYLTYEKVQSVSCKGQDESKVIWCICH